MQILTTINGATDVYMILGDPVEQVRAPELFNLVFTTLGLNPVLVPVHVPAAAVRDFVRAAWPASCSTEKDWFIRSMASISPTPEKGC